MTANPLFPIEEANDDDGPAIGRLIAAVFAENPNCYFVEEEFPELASVATHFRGKGGRIWVARDARAIVGTFAIAPAGRDGIWEIAKVYVAASTRGAGLGYRLYRTACDFAKSRGARRLELWTDTRFDAGHRFYERQSFVRGAETRFLHDVSETEEYFYARDL